MPQNQSYHSTRLSALARSVLIVNVLGINRRTKESPPLEPDPESPAQLRQMRRLTTREANLFLCFYQEGLKDYTYLEEETSALLKDLDTK